MPHLGRPENAKTGVFGDPQNIRIDGRWAEDDKNKKGVIFVERHKKRDDRAKESAKHIYIYIYIYIESASGQTNKKHDNSHQEVFM